VYDKPTQSTYNVPLIDAIRFQDTDDTNPTANAIASTMMVNADFTNTVTYYGLSGRVRVLSGKVLSGTTTLYGAYIDVTNRDGGADTITHSTGKAYGVFARANIYQSGASSKNYGIYATAANSDNINYAGYFAGLTHVAGELTATTKTFKINHPDPAKSGSYTLNHSAVETPTAGDNIYTYVVSSSTDNQTIVTDLPDYWQYLNENPKMWIQARGMFAHAYGEVSSSLKQMMITMEKSGSYDVLLMGTRKDELASGSWKGPEQLEDMSGNEPPPEPAN
jgi:hypothetical protein